MTLTQLMLAISGMALVLISFMSFHLGYEDWIEGDRQEKISTFSKATAVIAILLFSAGIADLVLA